MTFGRYENVALLGRDGGWSSSLCRDGAQLVEVHHTTGEDWFGGLDWLESMRSAPAGPTRQRVLALHSSGESEWIAFPFVARVSLTKMLSSAPKGLSLPLACTLARNVAADLHVLHEAGRRHDWVCSDTLCLGVDGSTRLDWRLAFAPTRIVTKPGGPLPHVESMAPELVRGGTLEGGSTDIYALGTQLVAMVTGSHPFRRDNFADELKAVTEARREPLRTLRSDVPDALDGLIDDMLDRDPHRRPSGSAVADRIARELDSLCSSDDRMAAELRSLVPDEVERLESMIAAASITKP